MLREKKKKAISLPLLSSPLLLDNPKNLISSTHNTVPESIFRLSDYQVIVSSRY